MMESSRNFFVVLITTSLMIRWSLGETRYYVKLQENSSDPLRNLRQNDAPRFINARENTRSDAKIDPAPSQPGRSRSNFRIDDETMIRESLKANYERRNSFVESATFDPDVLNKFLDEYASKIRVTTEKNFNYLFRPDKPNGVKVNGEKLGGQKIEISNVENESDPEVNKTIGTSVNSTVEATGLKQQDLNDTIKRNKYSGANANDDRNGWVTLEAIPWSKSKISKWQASSSSQRPWPDMNKAWEKPNTGKPWNSEFPSRPAYINNEPWHEAPKPQRPSYQSDRPMSRPPSSTRPSYFNDRFDDNPSQAQKWPPERPQSSWEKFPSADTYRPNTEIITDDRPSNFPSNWDKYTNPSNPNKKPSYPYNDRDRYTSNDNYESENLQQHHYQPHHQDGSDDWQENLNNYPSKFQAYKDKPSNFGRPVNDHQSNHKNRPQQLSHYQYTPDHPPSHPSSGDGQWVLLSTNRGYSKSRQRSLKMDAIEKNEGMVKMSLANASVIPAGTTKQDNDGTIAVMTSKRQVRLTVLPSINGTNTTTSHGGLLEVEKTFKTVDQSQKEYEKSKITSLKPYIVNNKPIRNAILARPSKTAVLAAVGAGMLPATMAVMIPMMLGRKKRSPEIQEFDRSKIFESRDNDVKLWRTRKNTMEMRKERR